MIQNALLLHADHIVYANGRREHATSNVYEGRDYHGEIMWCSCAGAGNKLGPEGGKAIGQALAASELTNLSVYCMSWLHELAMMCAYSLCWDCVLGVGL